MTKNQSLERGLEPLELVQKSDKPLGTRDMARKLGVSPAAVQRLVNTLNERNYLARDPETRRYRVGYQAILFGNAIARSDALLVEGRRELEEVTRKLRVDSYMATLQGKNAFYLLCVTGEALVSVRCEPGDTIPLHSTAIGKCILASLPDAEILEILGPGPYPAITGSTLTTPNAFLAEVEATRERGYAIVENENIEGITSVGALLDLPNAPSKTAISISFSPYFSKDIDTEEAAAVIQAAARRISRSVAI